MTKTVGEGDAPAEPKRILIIGTTCTGKTTLARKLSKHLSIPHIQLDQLLWGPNWIKRPEFLQEATQASDQESWVIEGGYDDIIPMIWPKADLIIWLNMPLPTTFLRLLRRTLTRAITRQKLFNGNRESIRTNFLSRDSILIWLLKTHKKRQALYQELTKIHPGIPQERPNNFRQIDQITKQFPKR